MSEQIMGKSLDRWVHEFPLLNDIMDYKEVTWFNTNHVDFHQAVADVGLSTDDIDDAADRLKRFAPLIKELFPETKQTEGIIESPLVAVPDQQEKLAARYGMNLPGQLWAKLDSELPISGSIKARGGIYEVLKHAEDLAIHAGFLTYEDDYRKLASKEVRAFFNDHKIAVGSTGNLGLSIGIMSAALGFSVGVHMSADARQWKKDKLRAHGVHVYEYQDAYSVAVAAGRKESASDPKAYFVDDENSPTLFLGYAVAARRLAGQLRAYDVRVDESNPLFVYLPCGVGGSPGGVAFGLKTVFGDNVRCIFVEPTHCPSMLLGVYTGLNNDVSVHDFGIDNVTAADGLACGRPSKFAGKAMQRSIDGFCTVDDDELFRIAANLHDSTDIDIEPSSAAGFVCPWRVLKDEQYREATGLSDAAMAHGTHLVWITGGSMVPRDEMAAYIAQGERLLN
ncbi:MAG: D-serine ammonia-lyase [Bifidobacterium sp.]|jgi:D-serine dehydratase|nr:D-serine ammonia-lyase [Bifidobacterium sp.]